MQGLKCVWAILIMGCLLLCGFLMSLLPSSQSYQVGNAWSSILMFVSKEERVKNIQKEDSLRFYQLMESYKKNLAAVPRRSYNQHKGNIKRGPPLSSILKEEGSDGNPVVKRILAWTTFFRKVDWIPKTICKGEIKSCISVTDRSELANVDGIVVHPRDIRGRGELPSKLHPHQRLIYLIQESPLATGIKVGDYNGVFNWTATYREDSDTSFSSLSMSVKRKPMENEEFRKLFDNIMISKTKLVAYMNSNCHSAHTRRLDFIRDVKTQIPVDVYGACGNLKCTRNTKECTDKMSQYKFYFALENAHCRDYITEKVSEPLLQWKAVPIVMGGADPSDYERLLPPNSYIHSAGFPNVTELVEFLLILDRNPSFYAQFHQWRKTNSRSEIDHWCQLCRKLHNTSLPIQYYENFKGWYEEDVCIA